MDQDGLGPPPGSNAHDPGEGFVPIETVVSGGAYKRAVHADAQGLTYGKSTLGTGEIETVAYWIVATSVNGIPSGTQRMIQCTGRGTKIRFEVAAPAFRRKAMPHGVEETWAQLVDWSQRFVEPRLRGAALAQIGAGVTVELSGLKLSQAGVVFEPRLRSRVAFPWSMYHSSSFRSGSVHLFTRQEPGSDEPGAKPAISREMMTPNAVLLPELCSEASRRWS
jgi:hypothetical protein